MIGIKCCEYKIVSKLNQRICPTDLRKKWQLSKIVIASNIQSVENYGAF